MTIAGDARVAGWLTGIDRDSRGITLHIQSPSGAVTLRPTRVDDVEFISYREDRRGTVSCGARSHEEAVIATFQPRPNGSDHAGESHRYRAGWLGSGVGATDRSPPQRPYALGRCIRRRAGSSSPRVARAKAGRAGKGR
jgi:hypothetical protein